MNSTNNCKANCATLIQRPGLELQVPHSRQISPSIGSLTFHTDIFQVQGSLDSNLKKNTAFIKRLRTSINPPTLNTFIQEIRTLSLHKYLSEIISACYEGLCKLKSPADTAAGVEIVSALHQRFGPAEFTGYLGWMIGRGLSTPDKAQLKALSPDVREREEKERLARQRILLRVATELWLVGVLRSLEDVTRPEEAGRAKDGAKIAEPSAKSKAVANGARSDVTVEAEPFPLEVLKDLLGHDKDHVNLPLVVLFVKTFAWDILGTKVAVVDRKSPEDGSAAATKDKNGYASTTEEDEPRTEDPPITSLELRQLFKNILTRYFEDAKNHLLRDQKSLVAQSRRNAEAYVRSGEVFEDRQANYEKQVKAQDKLIANAQVLADALGAEMPDLKEKEAATNAGDNGIGLVKAGDYLRGQGDGPGIWEDEDERRFYENLVDLKDRVPGILLEDGKKKKTDADEQVGKKVEPKADADKPEVASSEAEDQSTAIANKSVGAQVDALLARLPEITNKDMVDQAAIDFCFLNSKASRNRFIKAVQEIPKGRSDLLPLYSRLVATLSKYMPDISQSLVSYLDDEFRSLQRRKTKEFLGQVRTQNVRYLAELTKFGAVPEHVIFHCLKVALDDFSRMNIEIISNLLENGGRYLLRNPETSPRMNSFLETLQRKKGAQHLGQQERMLIENAMYYVNPPQRGAIEQKERTPLDMFVRKSIYLDLHKRNLERISKQIRKLHWEEDEVVSTMRKIFTKPGKIKFTSVHHLADLLNSLRRYHSDFVVSVVDNLLETITIGLELNDFKFNQRRLAEAKYLGELYIYRIVDHPLIFDTLYRIVTYGHEGGTPQPNSMNPLDLPDDYFRIRLVCTVLETCGAYYNKGPAKKKLDDFLAFFQYYIQTKDPVPMDTDFLIQDTFYLLRPHGKLHSSLEEASQAFAEVLSANMPSNNAATQVTEAEEVEDESGSEPEGDDDDMQIHEDQDDKSSDEEEEELSEDEESPKSVSDGEEEHIVVTRYEDERDPEADAEFDRELSKMMAESAESRKFERKQIFDVPLPMRRKGEAAGTATEEQPPTTPIVAEAPTTPNSTMKFSLLSKRGNRQLVSVLQV
jgi:regulator of nonsense transcripts 2